MVVLWFSLWEKQDVWNIMGARIKSQISSSDESPTH